MSTCFVIQPFDSGKFDKRFDDVYKPAIENAGLEAYRVDRDHSAVVAIDSIEDGIKSAAICLADITTDNPNVWYELGFALASGRPVVMVCSDERTPAKFPFDIQHRIILTYKVEAPRDFENLKGNITKRITALLNSNEVLRQISESEQVASTQGLSQAELLVIAVLAGETGLPGSCVYPHSLKKEAERAGLTAIGFSLAYRRLLAKGFAETIEDHDDNGNPFTAIQLSNEGWNFIDSNESLFVLKKPEEEPVDEVPF